MAHVEREPVAAGSSAHTQPTAKRADYPLIELLRAVAALLVLFFHVIEVSNWRSFPNSDPWRTLRVGWIGVDLFLVISGYVILRSALMDYGRSPEGFRLRFLTRRVARILPLYAFTTVIFIFLGAPATVLGDTPNLLWQTFTHLFFIHNLWPATHGAWNGVTWSIGLEMQFYWLIALAAPLLARRAALPLVLSFIALALAYRYGAFYVAGPGIYAPMEQFIYTTQLPGTLDAFGVGMLLALATERGSARLRAWFAPNLHVFGVWSLLGMASFALAMQLFWPRADFWPHVEMVTVWRLLLEVSFGCFLAAAITFPWADTPVLRPFRYLGEISYGIYLWHMMVILKLDPLPQMGGYRLLRWTLFGTCLLAAMTWHLFEKPAMENARRLPWITPRARRA